MLTPAFSRIVGIFFSAPMVIRCIKGSVDLLNVKVDRNARRLKELDLSVRTQNLAIRNLKSSSDKKFIRLQDGMDTVETILKMNNLIPG